MSTRRFFLPKPVYELLPILYLSLGAGCIALSPSIGMNILGAILIVRGLFKSILRVNYRSPDQALRHSPLHRRGH